MKPMHLLVLCLCVFAAFAVRAQRERPNILLVITDDLGWRELGCYGQRVIKTPNIDRLASEGMLFTRAYSGSCVCAPTRSTLHTGQHTGHTPIRDNREIQPEGQEALPAEAVTFAEIMRDAGYTTACVGKWGLGAPGSVGEPTSQGFDHFFGYLCQRHAHNHCPTYLYRDGERVELSGNTERNAWGEVYAPDLMREEAIRLIREAGDTPWLMVYATPVPHLALQAPSEEIEPYLGLDDKPYDGKRGYLPNETPRATYAAMVTRMDRDVGEIIASIEELGELDDTVIIFTSDNGPTFDVGGADSEFFHSAGDLRGRKGSLYEGGIRVPLIVRWPGRVEAGSTSDMVNATWDLFPTLIEMAGLPAFGGPIDGVSLVPELVGGARPERTTDLYWEYPSAGMQAARIGDIKGVRKGLKKNPDAPIEVYDLAVDPGEQNNLAESSPEEVQKLRAIMDRRERSPIEGWNFD